MSTIAEYKSLLASIGRAGLNALFPNDFEYYLISLELVDSFDNTVDYFSFPIVPNITKDNPKITNIKKTSRGVVALTDSSFIPKTFTLQGDFGRKFRILLRNRTEINFSALNFSTLRGGFKKENLTGILPSVRNQNFSENLKTGYGAIKILEGIYEKSNMEDERGGYKPYRLYFYNPTLGENYLVEPMNLVLSQSKDKNMIWSFNLTLKAIAPLEAILSSKNIDRSLRSVLVSDNIQKGVNTVASKIKSLL